jgi:asparagine synthase (glutamine-hydrolysing)
MNGLCGWFSPTPKADAPGHLDRMVSASRSGDTGRHVSATQRAALAAFGQQSRTRLIEIEGFVLAVVGHPRLVVSGGRTTNLVEIAKALRDNTSVAVRGLAGDFAVAGWNEATSRGLLAIDRIGVHQLVYTQVGGTLAFATTLDALAGYPGVLRRISPQAVFDYLYFHVCPGPETIYRGLLRLPAGHYIEFGQGFDPEPREYWSMRFREDDTDSLESLKRSFVGLLESAVGEAAGTTAAGSFLSGGTDSSTICGMLGRSGGRPARTFSIGFDVSGYDEMKYARIAAQHFGCEHREYYVTPADVVDAVPKIAAFYDQPFGNASAIPTYYCAKLAREEGVERLLAGDGGDELFGGNERYARQQVLGLYHRLPRLLRSALIEPLVLSTPLFKAVPGLRKVHSYVEQARPDMPWRYESYNLLNYLGAENVLEPDFLASVDRRSPQELLQSAHAPFAGSSLINQMLGIDLRFTLADNDLPKVTRMCELAGVDVAFPMLDERLVEFSALLSPDLKLRGNQLRWFFKEALRDFLPPEVLTKQKHGFGLPVGAWLVGYKPLLDMATESIRSLARHNVVQPKFVDELLGSRLKQHPKYFGGMVWVLMMLGLWLDSRGH